MHFQRPVCRSIGSLFHWYSRTFIFKKFVRNEVFRFPRWFKDFILGQMHGKWTILNTRMRLFEGKLVRKYQSRTDIIRSTFKLDRWNVKRPALIILWITNRHYTLRFYRSVWNILSDPSFPAKMKITSIELESKFVIFVKLLESDFVIHSQKWIWVPVQFPFHSWNIHENFHKPASNWLATNRCRNNPSDVSIIQPNAAQTQPLAFQYAKSPRSHSCIHKFDIMRYCEGTKAASNPMCLALVTNVW